MATFSTLQQFLEGAKSSFLAATKSRQPVRLVVGNEAADLDSFASSIIYAYMNALVEAPIPPRQASISAADEREGFFKRLPVTILPLLNIPRSELSLRPEHAHLIKSHLSFTADDISTLDDVLPNLRVDKTTIALVDHNVLQPPLSTKFFNNVTSIIDHHVDENKHLDATPRDIKPAGSCTSLVTNHFRTFYSTHWENIPASIHSEIAKLALAPILIDTANLTAKVTPIDVVQVTELLERLGEGFDRNGFYDGLVEARSDLEGIPVNGLLRKDYKQWTEEANGVVLGVSAITRALSWVVKKAGGVENFKHELREYAEEKKLDVAVVMTSDTSNGGFRRDLLIYGLNERTKPLTQRFEESMNEKFKLEAWPNEADEMTEGFEEDGMKAWTQAELDLSRKQVAPVLREIASKL
ncbi:Exopolyphosphatase [Dactylellina cionopaga]|nr:Exopolyphosphatase [Dactylellina cionopaga]